MSANCNLIIQKADKSSSVVLVKKDVYIRHIEKILDDATTFEKVEIKKGILNFSTNHERPINYLKSLEKSGRLTTDQYKKFKAMGSTPRILYDFVRYIKLSLMFVRHLDPEFWRLELLVINLQSI